MRKVKRKMWISIFGKLKFDQIIKYAEEYDLEILVVFKPDMMCDVHMGVKGRVNDIENFKTLLISNGNSVLNRCPRRSFQFEI